MADLPEEVLRKSFELNFFAHQNVTQAAVQVFRRQDMGGELLFNVSKQAVNPGDGFVAMARRRPPCSPWSASTRSNSDARASA